MGARTDLEGWRLLQPRARSMRCSPTEMEARLWQRLRRRNIGVRVRRQVVIGPFIVDFFCPTARLVVEVDGPVHEERHDVDLERDRFLLSLGVRVIRVSNEDVLNDLETVVRAVAAALVR